MSRSTLTPVPEYYDPEPPHPEPVPDDDLGPTERAWRLAFVRWDAEGETARASEFDRWFQANVSKTCSNCLCRPQSPGNSLCARCLRTRKKAEGRRTRTA